MSRSEARGARLVLAHNPRAGGAVGDRLWQRAEAELVRRGEVVARLATRGDGGDVDRLAALVEREHPDVVVAAGGDGTVGDAVAALLRFDVGARPALALLPMGTGNNVARSLGLGSIRVGRERAVDDAVAAAFLGERRRIDVGLANGRSFAGSFALGMDADILALRNRLCRRLGWRGNRAGYALYLASCAANLFSTAHGGHARLRLDGHEESARIYNLVVTNAPLYAGEFRFDGDNQADDGRLDLHCVAGPLAYLREHPAAWRRHLRHSRGERVTHSRLLRRHAEIDVVLDRPVAAQVDGEEIAPATRFELRVLPAALTVCVGGAE